MGKETLTSGIDILDLRVQFLEAEAKAAAKLVESLSVPSLASPRSEVKIADPQTSHSRRFGFNVPMMPDPRRDPRWTSEQMRQWLDRGWYYP